jgi:hypothetical protein
VCSVELSSRHAIERLQSGQAEELAYNAPHALRFSAKNQHIVAWRKALQTSLHDRSGCPQFMCSIGRETTLHLHRLDQSFEARIDGRDQGLNFTGRLVDTKCFMSVLRGSAHCLLRQLPQWLQVSPHASGASDKGGDSDDRRRPGNILKEMKELTEKPDIGIGRFRAAVVHKQPGHLQQCANR